MWMWVVILGLLYGTSTRLMRRYICKHHEQSSMFIGNDLSLGWFWLRRRRPLDFVYGISKTVDVVVCNSFRGVWAVISRKTSCDVFDGVIRIFILLNKGLPCKVEPSSLRIILKLSIRLDISSTTRCKLRPNAVVIVMWLVRICRRKNIFLVVRGIFIFAFYLPLDLLHTEVALKHEVLLQLPKPVDILLFLDVLLSDSHSLELREFLITQSMNLSEASIATLVQLRHDGRITRNFFVVVRIIFQILGSPTRQLFQQNLLGFCKSAIAHLEVQLSP
jgi:hypothetical protein